MQNSTNPIVSICCVTYNHEPYIRQCLDGFMMQQTDFPFEVLIHDDASTDGTADIIREYEAKYPSIMKPIYQTENQYSKGVKISLTYQFPRAQGKYIALCEGDDYWTDPYKLQKQVEFLEANEDFSLCCHRYKIFDERTKKWKPDYGHKLFTKNIEGIEINNKLNLMTSWLTKTMTVMYRKECLDLHILSKYKYTRDVHLFYYLLNAGKGYCMNYAAAVYRLHAGGIHSAASSYKKNYLNYYIFNELYLNNKNDKLLFDLKESAHLQMFYWDIISQLSKRKYSRKLCLDIIYFLKNKYKKKGLKRIIYCLIQFLLTIVKSFIKKQNSD